MGSEISCNEREVNQTGFIQWCWGNPLKKLSFCTPKQCGVEDTVKIQLNQSGVTL